MEKRHPQPGDYGLSTIGGNIGWWINLGQALTRDASRYTHAFVVLDDETVVEAMPSGARIAPLANYLEPDQAIFSHFDLTDFQREGIVRHARSFVGTPYGFSNYLSLALVHYGIRPNWLLKYVRSNNRMICSQLVDEAYLRAGVHLFSDGRDPGDVTPGDLLYALLDEPNVDV
jgi:uncharacterized protein YycO